MKKYRTGRYCCDALIEEIEVIKETATQIVVSYSHIDKNGNTETRVVRECKNSGGQRIHETYEDAKKYLIKDAETGIRCAKGKLKRAEEHFVSVLNL